MNDVIVREARKEDDPKIGPLLIDAFLTQYARHLPEIRYDEERRRELSDIQAKRDAGGTVLVAEQGGALVGAVTLFPPESPLSEAWLPHAADLRALATASALHGRKLSKPLLDAAESLVRQWGLDAVCLHVRKGVIGVARLYQARGYVRDPSGDLELPNLSLEAYALRFVR